MEKITKTITLDDSHSYRIPITAIVVAYYLSKYDANGLQQLGITTWREAYTKFSGLLRIKSNSLKLLRDEFDAHVENKRVGWQKPLSASRQRIADYFSEWKEPDIRHLVSEILNGEQSSELKKVLTEIGDETKLWALEEQVADRSGDYDTAVNYWVFQGSPGTYRVVDALRAGVLGNWSVTAHKNRIKEGDKLILWVTGSNSGCYALGSVTSAVTAMEESSEEKAYWINPPRTEIVDRCAIHIDLNLADRPITKEQVLANPILKDMIFGQRGTNFRATREQYDEMVRLATDVAVERIVVNPDYTVEDMSSETGIDVEKIHTWVMAIKRKGQAVFYGPPGTGKTYVAERLARHLVAGGDGIVDLVQFHPAYAYEDFMQGLRPTSGKDGILQYKMIPGRFTDFCRMARTRTAPCIMIIDEINRAQLAQVFGELMYLLEYRNRDIPLAGGGRFSIPENVFILGTMNTADRSIALVDHALRRRFAFLELRPDYNLLWKYHADKGFSPDGLIDVLKSVNRQIGDRNFELGVSFFLRPALAAELEHVWRMEIEPYLRELFFDRPERADEYQWEKIASRVSQ